MSEGLGARLARLRAGRGVAARELAAMTGVPYSDLIALESGARRQLSGEQLRRLADLFHTTAEYLLEGAMPSPAVLRAGFFRYYEHLAPGERERLAFAPIQARVEAVLQFLEGAYPTILDRGQVAARLGYSPEALADVLRDAAPLQSRLLTLLSGMVGLTMDFLVRGRFFGMSEYEQVVQEAIAAGVSPAALRKAVQILAIREAEHDAT